jgi:hypothetical protein
MLKQNIIIILLLLTSIIAISGCTTKTANNGTFGEKSISLNSIYLANNSTNGTYSYNGTEYYYVEGYLVNENPNDAFDVKVNTTAYDSNGNVIATNNSAYIDPTNIPANSNSYIYIEFKDPTQKIVKYNVQVVAGTGTV